MTKMVASLAAIAACALVVAQTAATASSGTIELSGTTSTLDPGTGPPCVLHGPYLVSCDSTGFITGFSGTLVGSSNTTSGILINCKTGRYDGAGTEVFTGSVTGVGSGTLTLRLHVSGGVTADCSGLTSFSARGVVVAATGDLAALNGTLSFDGSTYTGSLH
jgi:hypothetical protein